MRENPKLDEIVRINVGGTVFETTLFTLDKINDYMLSTMVATRWRKKEELFIDRDPTHFSKVLNYLRDGNAVLPADEEALESLRREAEFYNLPDLAKMCLSQAPDVPQEGSVVQWKESAINTYWKFFVRVDRTGTCHGYYSAKFMTPPAVM
ncbi:K+ channel tetramerization domain protein [Oesophagostomum dentatum]|uniref:K+ channel tetramerization domain protein n=1 Tax=Oesophagostomum dentatum TaxID=61180 RepID=A0A0B1T9F4_OESDE|nr:K+ channel tetramerization domain protein [Oesophagostomum dentatum]